MTTNRPIASMNIVAHPTIYPMRETTQERQEQTTTPKITIITPEEPQKEKQQQEDNHTQSQQAQVLREGQITGLPRDIHGPMEKSDDDQ
eukprot:Pgem_evm1s7181